MCVSAVHGTCAWFEQLQRSRPQFCFSPLYFTSETREGRSVTLCFFISKKLENMFFFFFFFFFDFFAGRTCLMFVVISRRMKPVDGWS